MTIAVNWDVKHQFKRTAICSVVALAVVARVLTGDRRRVNFGTTFAEGRLNHSLACLNK